jgi:predicted O-methyltransferase YrrM
MKNTINKLKGFLLKKIFGSIYKPGHYYSQIPSLTEIHKRKDAIFNIEKKEIAGIEISDHDQLLLLERLKKHHSEIPYEQSDNINLRYYYNNNFFIDTDAIILYSLIREFAPKRIIEVGSGFSSAVILDTNEKFFQNKISCTFIEPYPERLLSLLKRADKKNCTINQTSIQDINKKVFEDLEANDILFIDSSHVSKIGSDVNFLFFEILPRLKKGVIVHIHDICYPFEYPESWILQGIYWNEAYLLRAFLMFNTDFRILLFNNFLCKFHRGWLDKNMPSCKSEGGSFWMVKE